MGYGGGPNPHVPLFKFNPCLSYNGIGYKIYDNLVDKMTHNNEIHT